MGQGGEGQDGGDVRRHGGLEAAAGTEGHGRAAVQHQKHVAHALIHEHLGDGLAAAGGGAPIHVAQVVAPLVGTQVRHLQAVSAERG